VSSGTLNLAQPTNHQHQPPSAIFAFNLSEPSYTAPATTTKHLPSCSVLLAHRVHSSLFEVHVLRKLLITNTYSGWPLSRHSEIPWQCAALMPMLSGTHCIPVVLVLMEMIRLSSSILSH